MGEEFWLIDFPALIVVSLNSIICGVLGSFLVLKKQAVMVDAIAHSILPGIVLAVLISGAFVPTYVMSGALISALCAVTLVHVFQHWGKIEQGAAIGAVFTSMFALGVLLLETHLGSRVHLDTQHVLYGALELVYWEPPMSFVTIPKQIITLSLVTVATFAFLALTFKELKITTFDPLYANMTGTHENLIQYPLMVLTVLAAVSAFEAMGSILVIALFVCPAAAARLNCNTLKYQIFYSVLIGLVCSISGYLCATLIPISLGIEASVNSASVISLFCGLALVISIILSSIQESANKTTLRA
ncbi:MAG: metal ABC transporter permease [Alphaproteobacteria bacterium]|nr:metal ABC transporter permease [Alphaproteobacteria bacterium]